MIYFFNFYNILILSQNNNHNKQRNIDDIYDPQNTKKGFRYITLYSNINSSHYFSSSTGIDSLIENDTQLLLPHENSFLAITILFEKIFLKCWNINNINIKDRKWFFLSWMRQHKGLLNHHMPTPRLSYSCYYFLG